VQKIRALDTRLEALLTGEATTSTSSSTSSSRSTASMLDVRLTGVEKRSRAPATVVKQLWKTDKVSIPQLEQLLAGIAETDRPT
jgi:hypothetical protein